MLAKCVEQYAWHPVVKLAVTVFINIRHYWSSGTRCLSYSAVAAAGEFGKCVIISLSAFWIRGQGGTGNDVQRIF